MNPGQAWRVVSLIFVLAVIVMAALFWDMGHDLLAITLISMIILLVYAYVLYKRYHVEVVPESDISLFDDTNDLRILSRIYGLETDGDRSELRTKLTAFVRENSSRAFTWVAPKTVLRFGSTFELPAGDRTLPSRPVTEKRLIAGKTRSHVRLSGIRECPVCGSGISAGASTCSDCGADLEFYVTLGETKVGKRLLSQKNVAFRRKLRYEVPSLGDKR